MSSTGGNVRYIDEPRVTGDRSISDTINEAKEEFKTFAQTRLAMLQSEMREAMQNLRASAPMLIGGAVLGFISLLVLTGALIAIIWTAFSGKVYGPFLAFLIVGVAYGIIGFGALSFAISKIRQQGIIPKRTLRVLKEDKVWLQNEARTHL